MIEHYKQRHEQFLHHIIDSTPIPAQTIRAAMNYALFPGGKRIRPLLMYLVGDLIQVPLEVIDYLAAAIELTHCYSLIHDDLPAMDDDDMRRGKPSCHKAYDEATAILAGDGLQALALEILLSGLSPLLAHHQIIAISKELVHASGVSGMVSGQSLDLSELAQASVSEEQLRHIHMLKTGRLITACFKMVLAAQNNLDQAHTAALLTYAQHIGLVFQIQDDYLDKYAPTQTLGKGRSSDEANQKTTFASIWTRGELEDAISLHYDLAIQALDCFQEHARLLQQLTEQLRAR